MSIHQAWLVGAGAILIIALVSGRLHRVWLTEPLVVTVLGILTGFLFLDEPSWDSPASNFWVAPGLWPSSLPVV